MPNLSKTQKRLTGLASVIILLSLNIAISQVLLQPIQNNSDLIQHMIREQQLVPLQPWKALQIDHFSISAIPSLHTPPTAVNNDLGQEIAHPLPLPVSFLNLRKATVLIT